MYSLTYPFHESWIYQLALELGLRVRAAGYNGPMRLFSVIFDTEIDLIAFRDLVEEHFKV